MIHRCYGYDPPDSEPGSKVDVCMKLQADSDGRQTERLRQRARARQRERGREGERERQRETERDRKRQRD